MTKRARGGAMLVVLTSAAAACSGTRARALTDEVPTAVRTAVVEDRAPRETTRYSAIVAPNVQVDVAFRVSGYVVSVADSRSPEGGHRLLEPGAPVKAGLVLARVRRSDYQATVDKARGNHDEAVAGVSAAQAQTAEAQASLDLAQLDFVRVSALWQQDSITKPAVDGSRARLDVARAKVDAANAAVAAARQRQLAAAGQLKEAELALADTDLRSPLDGLLLERRVEVGSFAAAGSTGFVVADLHLVRARFNVPDIALAGFRAGQSLPLTIDAFPQDRFEGSVLSVAPAADPRARSFEIVVSIVNPALRLRSGMIASVQVAKPAQERMAVHIPIDALVHDPVSDRFLVYTTEVRGPRTVARALPVIPGPLVGNQVAILEGLEPGQRVVVSGANLLHEGGAVREVQ